eukprot:SAG11_NODE_37289_length_257_cov_1.297468_1_plen_68_part_01
MLGVYRPKKIRKILMDEKEKIHKQRSSPSGKRRKAADAGEFGDGAAKNRPPQPQGVKAILAIACKYSF